MECFKTRVGLRLVATVIAMCFVFQSISAMKETLDDFGHKKDENAAKHPESIRAKRSVQTNATHPDLPDIAKRLEAVEKQ